MTTESKSLTGRAVEAPQSLLSEPLAGLLSRIRERTARVVVVGQGYVGFPLAQRVAERGFPTIGLDRSDDVRKRCEGMNVHPSYRASSDSGDLVDAEVVIIAVPTPTLDTEAGRTPDLGAVRDALAAVGVHRVPAELARLVVIESTYAPGTTRSLAAEFLGREGTGRLAIGYSPERIDPGNAQFTVDNIPKVVSGLDDGSAQLVREFYDAVVKETVLASSVEAAEACKLLENTFRFINITFAHEFEEYCRAVGVSAREATMLAATKPFGYMPFHAGPGIGGHCIAEDPYYLHEAMRAASVDAKVLGSALENHENRAAVIADRIAARLGGSVEGRHVILLGVSYKPDVADTRRSPASEILRELRARGATVGYHDPLVSTFDGLQSIDVKRCEAADYDLAVTITRHTGLDTGALVAAGWPVFDPLEANGVSCGS